MYFLFVIEIFIIYSYIYYFNWNNYRLIEKVDAEIGVVLNALEASGTAENTLILFTADHGEAAGQHKMFQKFSLYEESVIVCTPNNLNLFSQVHSAIKRFNLL